MIFNLSVTAQSPRQGPISSASHCEAVKPPCVSLTQTSCQNGWMYTFRVEARSQGRKVVTRGQGRRRKSGLRRRSSSQQSVSITFCISQITHEAQVYLSRRAEADSQMVATKPYDWTYTTTYASMLNNAELSNALWTPGVPSDAHHSIPIAEISRSDRILSFAQITIFEGFTRGNIAYPCSQVRRSFLLTIHSESRSSLQRSSTQRVMPICAFIHSGFTQRVESYSSMHTTRANTARASQCSRSSCRTRCH